MPNVRITLGMAVAVIVCGLSLWTLEHWRSGGSGVSVNDAQGLLFPHGLVDAESLIVEQGAFRMDLQRQGGWWRQVEPFDAEVDQVAVRRILDTLSDLAVRERISLDELKRRKLELKDFGLSPAQTRVIVRTAARRIELDFGNRTPDGGEVFFCLGAASHVLVTSRAVLDALPDSLERVRERALLRDSNRLVAALELRRPGMPFVSLAHAGGDWQMTQPYPAVVDPETVERILTCLRTTRIEEFVWPSIVNRAATEPGNLRSRLPLYGLDADAAVQVQIREAGDPIGMSLRFGKKVEDHPGWIYALTVDEKSVVAVTNAVLQALLVATPVLLDRNLFHEKPDEITRVQLRFPDQVIECCRDAKRLWSLVAPLQAAADQEAVGRLLGGLLRLRAQQVVPGSATATESGMPTNPVCVVELATPIRTNRFAVTPGESSGWTDIVFTNAFQYVVAADSLPPAVCALTNAFQLCDRIVLAVDTSAVRRVIVRRGDAEPEAIERMPDSEPWQVVDNPPGRTAATDTITAWLTLLSRLKARRIERLGAGATHDLETYGLAQPGLVIKISMAGADAAVKVLQIGRAAADGGRYAMVLGHDDVIFVLGPETIGVLDRKLVQP